MRLGGGGPKGRSARVGAETSAGRGIPILDSQTVLWPMRLPNHLTLHLLLTFVEASELSAKTITHLSWLADTRLILRSKFTGICLDAPSEPASSYVLLTCSPTELPVTCVMDELMVHICPSTTQQAGPHKQIHLLSAHLGVTTTVLPLQDRGAPSVSPQRRGSFLTQDRKSLPYVCWRGKGGFCTAGKGLQ